MYSFMDVDTIPEPQEDVFPISPSPANEEHPPGSSDEDESDDEEEEAGSKGERLRRGADDMTILDIDDELADDKVPLPLQIPSGYSFVSSVPAALIAALVKQSIMLRLGVDWLNGSSRDRFKRAHATSTTSEGSSTATAARAA